MIKSAIFYDHLSLLSIFVFYSSTIYSSMGAVVSNFSRDPQAAAISAVFTNLPSTPISQPRKVNAGPV